MCLIQSDFLNAIRTTRLRMLVYLHLYTNMEEYVIVLAYQKEPHQLSGSIAITRITRIKPEPSGALYSKNDY